ncbi:Prp18 domain-containing protein [Pelagophyceae sp. CCMP2097]|nr:Prp18 domain-containing protein [Pelagophyceae sp. CCMP2097]
MDLLRAEIARKQAGVTGQRRWVKAGDLQKEREQALNAQLLSKKRKAEAPAPGAAPKERGAASAALVAQYAAPARKPPAAPAAAAAAVAQDGAAHKRRADRTAVVAEYSKSDVFKRLRSFGEPVTVFGEDSAARCARLVDVEFSDRSMVKVKSNDDGFALDAAYSTSNTFLAQDERAAAKSKGSDDEDSESEDDDAPAAPAGAVAAAPATPAEQAEQKGAREQKFIRKWISKRLKEWESDLAGRADSAKATPQGRVATKTYKQCKDYIRPLVKLLKQRLLEVEMAKSLHQITSFCDAGEFIKAHDTYVLVAIGSAPWPIGVTCVGVHDRGSKITSGKIAHVMNNEMQRKFLTSIKRLMRISQDRRPDLPPSMKVL